MRDDPPDPRVPRPRIDDALAAGDPSPTAPLPPSIQQQQLYRQLLQQSQQLRKVEGEASHLGYPPPGVGHGVSNYPHQQGEREETQNKGPGPSAVQNHPMHQAYLQYALQAAQQKAHANSPGQAQQQAAGPSWKSQDMVGSNMRMQDLMSLQAAAQRPPQNLQMEKGNTSNDQRNDPSRPSQAAMGQMLPGNMMRTSQPGKGMQNPGNNQLAQVQAMQAWAREHNVDPSQIVQLWQSARMTAMMKQQNETSTAPHQSFLPPLKQQQLLSSPAGSENSAHASSSSELSGHAAPVKSRTTRTTLHTGSISSGGANTAANSNNIQMHQHQLAAYSRENQNDKVGRHPSAHGNGGAVMHLPQSSGAQSLGHSDAKMGFTDAESVPAQHLKLPQQLTQPLSQPAVPLRESVSNHIPSQSGSAQMPGELTGFTKQQLHVLKAQILAFRRLKRGDHALPEEVLQAIAPPPLDSQLQQPSLPSGMVSQERPDGNNVEERPRHAETNGSAQQLDRLRKGYDLPKDESFTREDGAVVTAQVQEKLGPSKEPAEMEYVGKLEQNGANSIKSEPSLERGSRNISNKADFDGDEGNAGPVHSATSDAGQVTKPVPTSSTSVPKDATTRKYHGPLFDFPSFTRKHEPLGSTNANYSSNLTLTYDASDLLFEEGVDVLNNKRMENLKKISDLLAVNLERKRIRPDLVLRLQIEEKKLRLFDFQARLRDEVDQQQQEIMAMSDRPYRKFIRECERQRIELIRQVQQSQKLLREKQLKSIFQWRKKLLESHWAIRDARITRNRGVAKYHERMLKEFSKRKDEDRNKRMEALKNNDVDRYREMLMEQQTNVPGDAAQRYSVLSSFLSQTEEYLHKLGGKITATKNHQEVEEAANAAAAAARSQGLSEEEVSAAAACARKEVMIRNRFSEMNVPKDGSSVNKYYNLAHAVNERVIRQPSLLRVGTLRDYQLVGLQWMLSLYNNKLNGILADEMGLGKTVQVMALIAHLMEFKGNYGPHLIIVPNAVLVNWKSELLSWLPSVSCIFYVGGKDQRQKLFSQVRAVKFNVLVTTYEFVMYDRSKLSKIEWKYIIIDEAQRMKDRESVLARDLDRYRCHRRLLLTGTPLQNDLRELWSLLNLLLPEVFDNSKAFHDWFSKPFQKDGPSHNPEEDDWLETEKKVIIIHRLHQILEPFMLRRRVEDVEGSLPRKVSVVLRCQMSAIQSAIYDWIKSTGTLRVDPDEEMLRIAKNPMYQVKKYKNLYNKCMELRKVCNHPLLNYPYFNDYSKDFIVRSCGKLWILDRILIKLQRTGHRVLLFSTMTKLLDILEEYLLWRRLVYRRIDGTTSLEDRESAIVDFNGADSDCFIFLLSIRAAGRGLNLQSADTVVIYDPDPNPQNEEQAVARAHRIGQKREVKVIYLEAVVDKIPSYQKEDDLRNGGTGDSEDDLAGKDRYVGSIESLIRNNIQQYKIDMADEVINAGRFDQRTTHEERRTTLETLLHDDERYQETVHNVPSLHEVNRLIARGEEEIELFDQMDEEFDWTGEMVNYNQVPKWLRAGTREVNTVISNTSKNPSKIILVGNGAVDPSEISGLSPTKSERRRERQKGSSSQKYLMYRESDDDDNEDSDASSDRNASPLHEETEIGDYEDEESNGAIHVLHNNKDQSEEEGPVFEGGALELPQKMEGSKSFPSFAVAGSTVSSAGSRRLPQPATPSMISQKFGSLSALDARPGPLSKRMSDDLEEGEIAVSGDSHMDLQPSGSCIHDHDDGEDEQVLQPKLKRKRSIRVRPSNTAERFNEKSSSTRVFSHCRSQLQMDPELEEPTSPLSDGHDMNTSVLKQRRSLSSRKVSPVKQKSGRSSYLAEFSEDATEHSRGIRNGKSSNSGNPTPSLLGSKMSDSTQRKCKNVISKLQRRIDKDGHQVIPILYDWWKRKETSNFANPVGVTSNLLHLQQIEYRVDSSDYSDAMDFISDVQLMLKNVVRQCNYSYEVKYEAGKLQDLFFDIMKIAFPDTDFREARSAVIFSGPGGAATGPSPKQSRRAQIGEVEPDLGRTALKFQRESVPASRTTRDQVLPECSPNLGDLVICKKRRNDRDKSAAKQRSGPMSPPSPGLLGPLSMSDSGRGALVSPPSTSRSTRSAFQKDAHPTQLPIHHQAGRAQPPIQQPVTGALGVREVQWAKPVKKLRTDKRRPSHQ